MVKTAFEALAEFDAANPPSPAQLIRRAEEAEASAQELEELGNHESAAEERAYAAESRAAAMRGSN